MNKVDTAAGKQELMVYLPDTRGVKISCWGRGNLKLGMDGVYTYSRLPGRSGGTCPGATPWCLAACYAQRVERPVWDVWKRNTERDAVPNTLPADAKIVRIHVSGDFDSALYIESWITLAKAHPDVRFWTYTRSWRVPELLPPLERFRALRNVQLFASMDKSIEELPSEGWRRAWIAGDTRCSELAYDCPEETGRKASCQDCNYCVRGTRGDVAFLEHRGRKD